MSRSLRSSVLALAVASAVAFGTSPALAQQVGVGVGPNGFYGGYSPSYLGIFPGAYPGFWSNGFSLYGPPVPTYGTIPGTFGGADQRLSNFNNIQIYNGASIGLGYPGAGGAGPRSRHYAAAGGVPGLGGAAAYGQAVIEVRVPAADAEVFFEGINTRQNGTRRLFYSPAIPGGATYYYKVRARWVEDGKVEDQTRSVGVRANEAFVVDFTKPEAANDKRPLVGME
jgi:uncharacterized protein (TIGR03000 family)